MKRIALILALLAPAIVSAAPPPGHPSPQQARDMLMPDKPPSPAELPNQGKVISHIDANEFTYIEVERKGGNGAREWIAAPKMALKVGSTIRYEEGSVMTDFHSKLLQRTFARVMFVGFVAVVGD